MAIAIKRTPVLKGKAAERFNALLAASKTHETKSSIRNAIADAKAILANYKMAK